ncbi:MAG: hypothetical protein EPN21_11575 [Methylococcaceae bacterium]|nr:MAG: hypothetical protein EPN21_11575 [Methylococcaceae bacterium]
MPDVATQARSIAAVCGDALVGSVLRRLAELELGRLDLAIERARKELVPFESRFGRDSMATWEAWQSGDLGDDADLMEWMALTENFRLLLGKKAQLAASFRG